MDFALQHQVTLARPVEEVFETLALPGDLERLLRLSPMVTTFEILEDRPDATPSTRVVVFQFGEHVPLLPGGLYSSDVTMRVEQTIDRGARQVDYRSRSKGSPNIYIHKVRTFAPAFDDPEGSTTVTERIHGEAPFGLHLIAKRSARKAHVEHMDSYHRLFEQPVG